MKQHTLSFRSVPDMEQVEQTLASNLEYFEPDNFHQDDTSISFTTKIALRGSALESAVMSTCAHTSNVNQEY